jgi:Tfp pilus assembly protein PilV
MLEVILALLLVAMCVLIHDTFQSQKMYREMQAELRLVKETVAELIDVFRSAAGRARERDK